LVAAHGAQAVGVQERAELIGGAPEQPGNLDFAIADAGKQGQCGWQVRLREGANGEQLDADAIAWHQALRSKRRPGERPEQRSRRCAATHAGGADQEPPPTESRLQRRHLASSLPGHRLVA
jgi:hypothetical protein